jgi:hypothetical protein
MASGGCHGTPSSAAKPLPDPAGTMPSADGGARDDAADLVDGAVAAPGENRARALRDGHRSELRRVAAVASQCTEPSVPARGEALRQQRDAL